MKNFGKDSADEQVIVSKVRAREIIQVILDYGINQPQIYDMIYMLAMELENNEDMKKITDIIKIIKQSKESSILLKEE